MRRLQGSVVTLLVVTVLCGAGSWFLGAWACPDKNSFQSRDTQIGGYQPVTPSGDMGPKEGELYLRFREMLGRWRLGKAKDEDVNALLGWRERHRPLKACLVASRQRLAVGQEPIAALILSNESDVQQVVFPFRGRRLTDRGKTRAGARHDQFGFNEWPSTADRLYVIPPGEEVVIPLVLGAQPAGSYSVEVSVTLCRCQDVDGVRAFSTQLLVRDMLQFEVVLPRDGEVAGPP